jgi:hypothetical protein
MWFYSEDTTALMSEVKAVKDWYVKGSAQYDTTTNLCKKPTTASPSKDLATAKQVLAD